MPDRSDDSALTDPEGFHAWHTLLRAHISLINVLDRELQAATGLTMSTYEVLVSLYGVPERRCRMQQLSDAVLLSKSGTTRVVAQLEELGLVVREIPPTNRRTTHAVLTEAGTARIEAAMPVLFALVHEHFGRHLAPGDARGLTEILERVGRA